MVCPIRTCQPRQSLNGPCGIKYHYSASTAHLQRKHPHNPIAQRLVKRWKALHADDASGGRLISVTDLDNMEGCELKLWDKDWLDANLGTEDEPVGDIRPPPSDFPDHFAPRHCREQRDGTHRVAGCAPDGGHHSGVSRWCLCTVVAPQLQR